MSPNCSFLEFLAYILEKSSKFGIFSSQNETEIMFFWGPIGIFGLISSVWDVFNRIQSYLEPGNLKSSFFGNFKFEANFAHFLASKNDYSHKSAIFSWKKPKWSKKDENMYKVYRKYKKKRFLKHFENGENVLASRHCGGVISPNPNGHYFKISWENFFFIQIGASKSRLSGWVLGVGVLECCMNFVAPLKGEPSWNLTPHQAQIIALQSKLQAHETRHDQEMKWRKDEEKCANELLQVQLDEIQVTSSPSQLSQFYYVWRQEKLNTHIHVCVYAESFTVSEKEKKDWKTVDEYRWSLFLRHSRQTLGRCRNPIRNWL